jgi:hypothetical protein
MTQPHAPASAHGSEDMPYFPAAQWDEFKKEDIHAGAMVILLMTCIFGIGLVLYTVVAYFTGSGPS